MDKKVTLCHFGDKSGKQKEEIAVEATEEEEKGIEIMVRIKDNLRPVEFISSNEIYFVK